MKCPNDQTVLALSYRSGVEIDYCPECRGVWLDRGELDKLITLPNEPYQQASAASRPQRHQDNDDDDTYTEDYRRHGQPPKKKREGLLGELFDF